MAFDYAPKIAALIANANDEALPEATRAMYQAKAEELMRRYRIAEEEALATDPGSSAPMWKTITIMPGYDGGMVGWYAMAVSRIAIHTGTRAHVRYDSGKVVADVCGYEGDVRYAEFLWTAVLLTFNTRINPKWDDTLPEVENVYRLRNAGIERRVIADQAWGNGHEAAARSKVQRIYLRECARRNETPRATGLSHDTKTYREAYAREFIRTLTVRFREARDAVDSTGGALVMAGREDRVNEAFYERYPSHRPADVTVTPSGPCDRCAKSKSGVCRDHRVTAADMAAYRRAHHSPSARAGAVNGRLAAQDVRINRGHTPADRVAGNTVEAIGN